MALSSQVGFAVEKLVGEQFDAIGSVLGQLLLPTIFVILFGDDCNSLSFHASVFKSFLAEGLDWPAFGFDKVELSVLAKPRVPRATNWLSCARVLRGDDGGRHTLDNIGETWRSWCFDTHGVGQNGSRACGNCTKSDSGIDGDGRNCSHQTFAGAGI